MYVRIICFYFLLSQNILLPCFYKNVVDPPPLSVERSQNIKKFLLDLLFVRYFLNTSIYIQAVKVRRSTNYAPCVLFHVIPLVSPAAVLCMFLSSSCVEVSYACVLAPPPPCPQPPHP